MSTTDTCMVLMPGSDARVLGLSSRTRNRRVAARAGVTIVDAADPGREGRSGAVLVPPDVLIELTLFPLPVPRAAVVLAPDGRAILDISTATARRQAAWTILGRTAKATDGWVSRHCNRPISRVVSYAMLSAGLSASHASVLTLLAGLVGAVLSAEPGPASFITAGVLFQLASVLDGVDGEMARATLTESEAGARLDTIVDQITYIAFFLGVTIGWVREGDVEEAIIWTVVVALGLVLSLMRGARFVSKHAPNASFVFIDRSVRRAAQDSGSLVLRGAASLFSLLRRDVFAVVFLVVSFTGERALVPALVGFGVLLANFTFSIYGRELAAAAEAERRGSR